MDDVDEEHDDIDDETHGEHDGDSEHDAEDLQDDHDGEESDPVAPTEES